MKELLLDIKGLIQSLLLLAPVLFLIYALVQFVKWSWQH